MSQLDSSSADAMAPQRGVIVQKPKTNIFTVMLIIAFLAMCMACLFLWLEAAEYNRPPNAQLAPTPTSTLAIVETALT